MKASSLLAVAAVAVTSTEACARYKNCWCERSAFTFEGKLSDNIPWDDFTQAACGKMSGTPGWYLDPPKYKECYRHKKYFMALKPSKALNNCDWTQACKDAAGPDVEGTVTGWCREKIGS
ncbi:hypothetical protein Cob_v006915 [Colletotrichum orbiculare MAFF 240422]|uniref:Uncharacterized protein n=1 Tax=Colletotrichum orbiculare (strain 104-T / ATCC 96160 / CBS 514.97 / LARS 414 / MAFF 240422) TaxID=1213857 RepID=N4VX49_COLOR|nr:hypothetical protein Cob_v006915 [Colletotrichum orbiculare MAFF 240422]